MKNKHSNGLSVSLVVVIFLFLFLFFSLPFAVVFLIMCLNAADMNEEQIESAAHGKKKIELKLTRDKKPFSLLFL